MAVEKKQLMAILAVVGAVVLGVGSAWAAWRVSNGEPVIPGFSSARVLDDFGPLDGCQQSGCPDGQICKADGSCESPPAPDPEPSEEEKCFRSGGTWFSGTCHYDFNSVPEPSEEQVCRSSGGTWWEGSKTCKYELAPSNPDPVTPPPAPPEDDKVVTTSSGDPVSGDSVNTTGGTSTGGSGTCSDKCIGVGGDNNNDAERACIVECKNSGGDDPNNQYKSGACANKTIQECIDLAASDPNLRLQVCDDNFQETGDQAGEFTGCDPNQTSLTDNCGQIDILDSAGNPVGFIIDMSGCTSTPTITSTSGEITSSGIIVQSGSAYCTSASINGSSIVHLVRGDNFSGTMIGSYQSVNGGTATYTNGTPVGSVSPTGPTSQNTSSFTLTAAQTSALSLGSIAGPYVRVTDNRGAVSGGPGTSCAVSLYVTDTVIPPGSPYWVLNKTGSSVCTSNRSSSTVTYTVTVANLGDTSGTISQVVDTLDSRVTSTMVSAISDGGTFNNSTKQIVWNNSGSGYTIGAQSEKVFTYKVTFSSSQFGTYSNSVAATPNDGSSAPDGATNTMSVGCYLPQTAITDNPGMALTLFLGAIAVSLAFVEIRYGLFSGGVRLKFSGSRRGLSEENMKNSVYRKKKKQ